MSQIFGGNQQGNISTGDSLLDLLTLGFMPAPARANREGQERDLRDAGIRNQNAQAGLMEGRAQGEASQRGMAEEMRHLYGIDLGGDLYSGGSRRGGAGGSDPKPPDPNKARDSFANTLAKGYKAADDAYWSTLKPLGETDPLGKVTYSAEAIAKATEAGSVTRTDFFRGAGFTPEEMERAGAYGGPQGSSPGGDERSLAAGATKASETGLSPDEVYRIAPELDQFKVTQAHRKTVPLLHGMAQDEAETAGIKRQATPEGKITSIFAGEDFAMGGIPKTGMEADLKAVGLEQAIGAPLPKALFTFMDVEQQAGNPYDTLMQGIEGLGLPAPQGVTPYAEAIKALWDTLNRIEGRQQGFTGAPSSGGMDAGMRTYTGAEAYSLIEYYAAQGSANQGSALFGEWMMKYGIPLAEKVGSAREYADQLLSQPPAGQGLGGMQAVGNTGAGGGL